MRPLTAACAVALVVPLAACTGVRSPARAPVVAESSPLAASYVFAWGGATDELLGRTLAAEPQPGRSIAAGAVSNPCDAELDAPVSSPVTATFRDAVELPAGAAAALGFGARSGSHLVYEVVATEERSRLEKAGYAACCKERACGFGYVAAMLRGSAVVSVADEIVLGDSADVTLVDGSSERRFRLLESKTTEGFVVVAVAIADPSRHALYALGAPEEPPEEDAASVDLDERYEDQRIAVVARRSAFEGKTFVFRTGAGTEITERDFAARYAKVTGSNELAAKVGGGFNGWYVLAAVGVVPLVAAVPVAVNASSKGSRSDDPFNDSGAIAGGDYSAAIGLGLLGVALVGAGLGAGLTSAGTGVTDHALSEADARAAAERHNRALRKKLAAASGVAFTPMLGPLRVGARWTF